ncbi:MAG TPA: flagellar basal body protein, partial [Burkholderiaceae bacterium]|nr:flagellar basal body protein [Burkholderiaceae bacterium]
MDRMIYTAMTGAKATLQRQDALANNLANANTQGFRRDLEAFRAVPIQGDSSNDPDRVYASV